MRNGCTLEIEAEVGTHTLTFNAKQKYGKNTNFQVVVNNPDEIIRLNAYFGLSGNLIIEYADNAPHFSADGSLTHCVQPKKKSGLKALATVFICMFLAFIAIGVIGSFLNHNTTVDDDGLTASESVSANDDVTTVNVGETLNANGIKISFLKVEDWQTDNMFMEAEDGYKYIRAYFVIENTKKYDYIMGGYDFQCYADNAKVDDSSYGDNQIDYFAEVSSGRKIEGYMYYEVPINAKSIEIEYETSFWTNKKAIFKVK